MLQKTKWGWIVSGKYEFEQSPRTQTCFSSNIELENTLNKCWRLEKVYCTKKFNEDEQYRETYFHKTKKREPDGKFVVRLPFNEKI